jgi:cell division protein FtsL
MAVELRAVLGARAFGTPSRALQPFLFPLGLRAARKRDDARRRKPRPGGGAEIGRSARLRNVRTNALAGAFALAVGLFHVWTGLEVGQLGYALSDARILTQRLDEELHELTVEYATETAPETLEARARERLGLRPPAPGQVVILR